MLLSIILTVGLSIIVGVVVGLMSEIDEVGASAGMLVPAMWGGILLTRRATRWFDVDVGPLWSRRLVALACSAPLLAIGAAPALDRHGHEALGLLIGLVVVSIFTRWEREFTEGAAGDLRINAAVRAAFFALVMSGIATALSEGEPMYMAVAATVAGVVSICLQPTAWWLWGGKPDEIAKMNRPRGSQKYPDPTPNAAAGWGRGDQGPPPPPYTPQPAQPPSGAMAPRTAKGTGDSAPPAVAEPALPQRWGITRAFWGLAAFVFMGGAIVTFLIPLTISNLDRGGVVQSVTTCIAFTAALLFALRKTTPFKREGIWRETFRPFLISLSLFGIGATITALAAGGSDEGKNLQVLVHEDAEHDATALLALDSVPATLAPGVRVPKAPLPPEECEDTQVRVAEGKSWKERIRAERERGRARAQQWRENLGQMIRLEMGHSHWRTSNTAACIVGLVFSSLIFLTLLLFTGRRRRPPAPFVRPSDSGHALGQPYSAPVQAPATPSSSPANE